MSEERSATPSESRRMWRRVAGISMVLWVAHRSRRKFLFFQAPAHAEGLLGSLDRYLRSRGHYPGDLREPPEIVKLDESYRERVTYTAYAGGSNFFLSASHPFSKEVETYASKVGHWRHHDLRQMRTVLEEATSES